jgi:hypothetical protein
MARIRIVCLGALAAVALALAVNGAAAQTSDSAGTPLPLLAGLKPPHTAKIAHAETSHAKTSHKKVARLTQKPAAEHHHESSPVVTTAEPAAPAAQDNVWPTPQQATSVQATTVNTVAVTPPPQTAPASPDDAAAAQSASQTASATADDAPPNAVVMNGQTVEIASPDYLNDIDRAADDRAASVVTEPSRDATTVGSASWIAQVMAALGGAAAAGAIAWFLIGSGPARTYG